MKSNEFNEFLDNLPCDYTDPRTKSRFDQLIEALQLLKTFLPPHHLDFSAEHDVLYLAACPDDLDVPEETLRKLNALGVHWDTESGCFARFT